MASNEVWMVDYGAGNVRSLINAVSKLGWKVRVASSPDDIRNAQKLLFPGVGAFGSAMEAINSRGYAQPIKDYINSGRPFMGICIGIQSLCEGSEEAPGVSGLGVIPATVQRFSNADKAVPQIGWNCADEVSLADVSKERTLLERTQLLNHNGKGETFYYFVHSYMIPLTERTKEWVLSTTTYGGETFVSAVRKGNVFATQFHPEKSGFAGLRVLKSFLTSDIVDPVPSLTNGNGQVPPAVAPPTTLQLAPKDHLTKRVIACLDVRANDAGDLVVTKGDQYDVREKPGDGADGKGEVRNLGKPVDLARRYFEEGADEVTFLNITSFRNVPLADVPMLEVLRRTSESVFVPLTIGGGIRDVTDPSGAVHSALEVAGEYFRSGADKVSIGSDAVFASEALISRGGKLDGTTSIEQISWAYGAQAVVISVDPRRVYVASPEAALGHAVIETAFPGPNGERFCWYQCTVKGGREGRDLDVVQLTTSCEKMGAGEILLNCMDKDGTNSGYDLELIRQVKSAVRIPVIASSGAGHPQHFAVVFEETGVEAALAAGIFHRREVPIEDVKKHLKAKGHIVRPVDSTSL
ncbi:glutamine amidotransferase/cyclase [Gonapodya prolifera JEL478]|uniref:Imidazole glycerol phosphate synthase hisHF n=1 Tax=Gonapodya prolifera (strain JEL478) TaxID=1344416 RepID=A0A138ZZA6_GONPJ|nr:glutamine amidotransferase/cyclase [Gonapodya prolifera JEL478]|eukprot:KXS09748.1 glutamine amidotransferase/cyclase [Gonapodya prolifera JEL478]